MLVNPNTKFRDIFGLLVIFGVYMGYQAYQDLTVQPQDEPDEAPTCLELDNNIVVQVLAEATPPITYCSV